MQRHRHTAAAPRDRAFWIAASVLVLGQLVAFWMLCSHQVRMAEVRHASAQVERLAVADCLRYVPNATMGSCSARMAPLDNQVATAGQPAPAESATPVNYVYH
jgi:hypothetical protein